MENMITVERLDEMERRFEDGSLSPDDIRQLIKALRNALQEREPIYETPVHCLVEGSALKPTRKAGESSVDRLIEPLDFKVFTDGACKGNPGPGAWATIIQHGGDEDTRSGFEPWTTNNRMELMAVIEALRILDESSVVTVVTDSRYVRDGISKWIHAWKKNGWRTSTGAQVKNAELWRSLDGEAKKRTVNWEWVPGHSGHPENARCDSLARATIVEGLKKKTRRS
jgi:ribonuclease HI